MNSYGQDTKMVTHIDESHARKVLLQFREGNWYQNADT